jgi:hypothetical protein
MRTDDQMRQEFERLTDLAYRAQINENFTRIGPALGKLRIVVICFPFYSNAGDFLRNIFPDGKSASFANPLSPQSRLVSTALVRAWTEQFAEHVRAGNGVWNHLVSELSLTFGSSCRPQASAG